MRFEVLGPLAVWDDRGERVAIPGRKVRALLADLLLHEGRTVAVDRLVEDVWGETAPADPVAALHVRVSQLRRALAAAESGGRDLVESRPPGYALRVGPETLDTLRFESLVDRARTAGTARTRAGLLSEALELWRGTFLADFADDAFVASAASHWVERRLAAVEACAEARLEVGEHRELAAELEEEAGRHPYRERLRAAHMRALHRAGRTSDALASYQELRRRLADELGLDPGPELAGLHRAILSGDPAEDASAEVPPVPVTNLPAPVAVLYGRDRAVERVRELLATGRLVTVTGPGGVGKTSLAFAAARAAAAAYPDGVWLVDLTAWDGTGEAAEPILAALSVPEAQGEAGPAAERLAAALRDRRTLLVLDNCEHVVDPIADLVGALLQSASELQVLATSREPLRLSGEARFDVPTLAVPETDDPGRLAAAAAVRLFLARSGLADEPRTVAAAAEVSRRLDGLPLALELAATRARALGMSELVARLGVPGDRFGLLGSGPRDAPARQRTLASVIDWSWRLLGEAEQTVLRRLSVHSGGFTLEAAETVCAGGGVSAGDVLDLLAGLVDRSLVVSGGQRFRLLESVAAFSRERLCAAEDESGLRRRHADYYLDLAERAETALRGPDQGDWLRRLDAEAANVRAAQETFRRTGAADEALRLATAMTWYWFLRGRLTEARRALAAALDVDGAAPNAVRAKAAAWHAGLAIRQAQAGPDRAEAVMRMLEAGSHPVDRGRAAWFLAGSIIDFGDERATRELLDRAMTTAVAEGDRWCEAAVLSVRAMLDHMRGDLAALEADARRGARLFGEIGDDWGFLQATEWLIGLADLTGDHAEAARLSREGLRIAEELGLWSDVAGRVSWLAWIAVQVGDYSNAIEHAARARRMCAEQGQRTGEVFATLSSAFAARRDGKLDVAEEHLRWLLATAREQQGEDASPPYLAMVLTELGLLAAQRHDAAAAMVWHREGFEAARAHGTAESKAWALVGMAEVLALEGDSGVAARLLGAAAIARERGGMVLSLADRVELDRISAAVKAAESDFEALHEVGAGLTLEQGGGGGGRAAPPPPRQAGGGGGAAAAPGGGGGARGRGAGPRPPRPPPPPDMTVYLGT
jgi:predicted ATPase/DNA-binding SARP family transcriptional activator